MSDIILDQYSMRIIRQSGQAPATEAAAHHQPAPWKVMVVDDDPDVHALTRVNLKRFTFDGRKLQLISAMSAAEAREILSRETDVAVALVDVVMESETAGLELVEAIRNEFHNQRIRLIIRTGQPGVAPERHVIDNYDIDDYKDKTELTAQKLYTTIRSALKAYRDIMTIESNRRGLERILEATPGLYLPHFSSIDVFFQGVLTQIIGLCRLGENGLLATVNGFISTLDHQRIQLRAGTGAFQAEDGPSPHIQGIQDTCSHIVMAGREAEPGELDEGALLLPLKVHDRLLGYIYLETTRGLEPQEHDLLRIMANQCAAALENVRLHLDLKEANKESLFMLAVAAEFKDQDTGAHIHRVSEYTRLLAMELGTPEQEAELFGQASMLHDIGKLGIPDAILQKHGQLTQEEVRVVREHPTIGAHILEQHKWFHLACDIAHGHHERWDGTGYPRNLRGEEIPLVTRIVSVVDVFDALTHARAYKTPWPLEKSVAMIQGEAGRAFDPQVVAAFLQLVRRGVFPLPDHPAEQH